ncbi:hypothetical protein Sp245p_07980 [Azospirillum baldaniorum]|uniref:DUF3108 domain-containing protein n=1 Tax=Azospirillum baldaniorum TaxID=1064539 RepID=A0A9P1NMB5_9PROT|nr:DUF6134 family protein [Azospirillum baldaniorum]AWJ89726.1 hypothetical protein Sp245p_07980 [Azospirillum baldaniorum]TWA76825.1 hypothetical protein FBZ85_108241 [Azospirillum brasilense]CCC98543.1 conserved exported protein of unknown function [Azospirillum baldaniorum]
MTHALRAALAAAGLLLSATAAHAAEPRTLTYRILMGDDPVGSETVRLEPQGEVTKVAVTASTRVKVLFINFRYDHKREEVWKGRTLESMSAQTDDDGTPHTIRMLRTGGGYSVTVDGKTGETGADALPLTLWTPEVLKRPTLLSVIDGKPYSVRTDLVGTETLTVGGRAVPAQHHRISGDVERDLWFDAQGTLLKTRFKRSGYDVTYILD